MNIEIGRYYVTCKNELVYVFGFDALGEGVSWNSDLDLNPEKLVNALGMKHLDRLDGSRSLDFHNCIESITVYKDTHEPVDGKKWYEFDPDQEVRERFEATSRFLNIISMYIDHMQQKYLCNSQKVTAVQVFRPELVKLWALQRQVKN